MRKSVKRALFAIEEPGAIKNIWIHGQMLAMYEASVLLNKLCNGKILFLDKKLTY